jgi:hypothetical protein
MKVSSSSVHSLSSEEIDRDRAHEPVARTIRSAASRAILGGLVAGTVDLIVACLLNHAGPTVVLPFVASGLIGKAAFHAGYLAIALGLALQLGMSMLIASLYVLIDRRVQIRPRGWVPRGIVAGLIIFVVMNFIVLPLSAAPHLAAPTALLVVENVLAMVLFGLIVAYFGRAVP